MKVLYVCPLAHLTGHPPFECTKEARILKEHGVDVELLTFCGVHEGFDVDVPQIKVMPDNWLFRSLRKKFVTQWMLRVVEYITTNVKALCIAGDRPIYLRDGEPFPHLIHIMNIIGRKRWVISSTGGLFTTGTGVSKVYKSALKATLVNWSGWYKLGKDRITYSVQDYPVKELMSKLLGDNITVVSLGHKLNPKTPKETALNELGISNKKTNLLILGANHAGKDPETVFKALTEMGNMQLIHAGPSKQSLGKNPEELAAKYKSSAIVLNRQIGNEEKKRLFGAADWVVMSYKDTFSSTTSMLWEACSYEVPVIASSGTELEKLVRYWNVGLVFQVGDEKDLRLKLQLASEASLRDSFKLNCRDFIQFYSEDKWCDQTLKLLQSR